MIKRIELDPNAGVSIGTVAEYVAKLKNSHPEATISFVFNSVHIEVSKKGTTAKEIESAYFENIPRTIRI